MIASQAMTIIGVIAIFLVVFGLDLVSGIAASIHEGKKIESGKARWSFVKTMCYFFTFSFTLFCGACLNVIDVAAEAVKLEVYVALWIETLSICENMMRIFPSTSLWAYLHHMLAFEWCKRIAGMTEFLKEKEHKKDEVSTEEE